MNSILDLFDTTEYVTEVAYTNRSELKEIEKEFEKLTEYYKQFYGGMKKHGLNPKNPGHVFQYYYSSTLTEDGRRITQYNEYLKKIEDIVKKMFRFRSVNIEMQLINLTGPNTSIAERSMVVIPFYNTDGTIQQLQYSDVGVAKTEDGEVKYKVGYKSVVKASSSGITDTTNSITINIYLQMYDKLTPRNYVAILLHEIGHNLDRNLINMEVKNDGQMIRVISDAAKADELSKQPNALRVLMSMISERVTTRRSYSDILNKRLDDLAKSVGYGGTEKSGELYADSLPTSFGYGPALIDALTKVSSGLTDRDMVATKSIISAYKNYKQALRIAADLSWHENNTHGSNAYRLKVIMKQLQEDLKECKDPTIKRRIMRNMRELETISEQIIMAKDRNKSKELKHMLKVWMDHIKV